MNYLKKYVIIITISALSGITAGSLYGLHIINKLMDGNIGISLFIFTPQKNLIDTMILLNSNDELKRIEGYYSYKDSGLNDLDFLFKRYKIEKSDLARKTILWIAIKSSDTELLNNFYKKCYDISSDPLKKYLQTKINSYDLINTD